MRVKDVLGIQCEYIFIAVMVDSVNTSHHYWKVIIGINVTKTS